MTSLCLYFLTIVYIGSLFGAIFTPYFPQLAAPGALSAALPLPAGKRHITFTKNYTTMEQQNIPDNYNRRERRERLFIRRRNKDGAATGIFLVLIGAAILINKLYPELPGWLFSWKTFLIALGFYLGYKNRFQMG